MTNYTYPANKSKNGSSRFTGNKWYSLSSLAILSYIFFSQNACKKFVTIDPPNTQVVSRVVYSNDATAIAVVRGIYSQMISSSGFAGGGLSSITLLAGLSADELTNYSTSTDYIEFYTNSIFPSNSTLFRSAWQEPYKYINNANAVLEGLANSSGITEPVKKQLEGEAKFVRAFCNFHLVNLFGDIPLVISTDYKTNSIIGRTMISQVYQQILSDLTDAQHLLKDDFSFSNNERNQPNRGAATALLARTYLYMGNWASAAAQATSLINNTGTYTLLSSLNNVFLKNSPEAIWQLKPTSSVINTNEGNNFILTSAPANVALTPQLINTFENNDKRKDTWTGSITTGGSTYYFPYKYKIKSGAPLSEYSMILRLAEQYLIRAECRARQNDIQGAQADINIIRNRAGLSNTTAATQSELLNAILYERQTELFTEWGHRWLDLKRLGLANTVLGPLKDPNWKQTDILFPIPQSELLNDKNLIQNPGY